MIALAGLRQWVFDQLSGNITGTVHSRVGPKTPKPYTVIASMTSTPWDTHSEDGSEDTVTLSIFDDGGAGSGERVETIMAEADAILHDARITLGDGKTGWLRREFADSYTETVNNEINYRGVLRYRAFTS